MEKAAVRKLIDGMSLERKVGQMFMANICAGETVEQAKRDLEEFGFGGLQYSSVFERFVRGGDYVPCGVSRSRPPEEDAAFLHAVKAAARETTGIPVIIAGDQEGGLSSDAFRRGRVATMPSQMGLGANGSPGDTYRAAAVSAREMKVLGLDMLYGPSLDVNTNPLNPEIGHRAFSDEPEVVAVLGEQVIRAYAAEGVIATAKHFPGRGEGKADAHHELESIDVDGARLRAVELVPFRRAVAAGVDAVMTGHMLLPAVEKERVPSSLSRAVVTGLLREELGFDGLVIPDTLTMFAISKNFDVPAACAMCLEAGADMVFMKVRDLYRPCVDAIMASVRAGRLTEERVEESLERILGLKARRGLFDEKPFSADEVRRTVGCAEHEQVARGAAERAVVVLKDDGLLPVRGAGSVLAVVPRDPAVVLANDPDNSHDMLPGALGRHFPGTRHTVVDAEPTEEQTFEAAALAKNAGLVVVMLPSRSAAGGRVTPRLGKLLERLVTRGKPVVVVLTGTPYAARALPREVRAVLDTFGAGRFNVRAAADVIAGALKPTARLPVRLEG